MCGFGEADIDCCCGGASISDVLSAAARELIENHLLLSGIYDITDPKFIGNQIGSMDEA
jgi:hypothetical protein